LPPSGAVLIVPAGPTVPFANSAGLLAVHVPQVVDHVLMLSASADVLSSVRAAIEIALIVSLPRRCSRNARVTVRRSNPTHFDVDGSNTIEHFITVPMEVS
jgi:hypothetical protein